jgi:hypothetical protein
LNTPLILDLLASVLGLGILIAGVVHFAPSVAKLRADRLLLLLSYREKYSGASRFGYVGLGPACDALIFLAGASVIVSHYWRPLLLVGVISFVWFLYEAFYRQPRLRRALRARVIHARYYVCPECEYILLGSRQDAKCPECGKPFDIVDLRRYWSLVLGDDEECDGPAGT